MAKNERRRFQPQKKGKIPAKLIQWGVVVIVVVGVVVVVTSSLSRPATETPPAPFLADAKSDPFTLGQMLGEVAFDSATRALFPRSLAPKLVGPDSLIAQRRWYDALEVLLGMFKRASQPESAAIYAYMGYCFDGADSPDRALRELRRCLAADSSPAGLAPWAAFSVGWMFQNRGYSDSCLQYYRRAERLLGPGAGATPDPRRAALLNNIGVALEAQKDTAGAAGAYRQALPLVDSLASTEDARTVRDNLARVSSHNR
jgi:tetratricopeptide (TPR) repeat protein